MFYTYGRGSRDLAEVLTFQMILIAFATFRFKTQPELEELVRSLYSCEMRVVHVSPGKEPLILLSHFSNELKTLILLKSYRYYENFKPQSSQICFLSRCKKKERFLRKSFSEFLNLYTFKHALG